MPEFQRIKLPPGSFVDGKPTTCLGCSTHRHPDGFVDLLFREGLTSSYMCAGCVAEAARLFGMVSRARETELRNQLAAAQDEILALQAELDAERDNKLVSLADVKELVRQRGGRPPTPAAA